MVMLRLDQNTKIERSTVNETTLLPGTITECCTTSEAESTGSQMIFCVSGDPPGCPEAPEGAQRHPWVPKGAQGHQSYNIKTDPAISHGTQEELSCVSTSGVESIGLRMKFDTIGS